MLLRIVTIVYLWLIYGVEAKVYVLSIQKKGDNK